MTIGWKITKIDKFDWEPVALAGGGTQDTLVGTSVFFQSDDEGDAWARFFDAFEEYEVTIVGPALV